MYEDGDADVSYFNGYSVEEKEVKAKGVLKFFGALHNSVYLNCHLVIWSELPIQRYKKRVICSLSCGRKKMIKRILHKHMSTHLNSILTRLRVQALLILMLRIGNLTNRGLAG